MADLGQYLHQLLEHRGSDLHLKVGAVAHVRVDGRLVPLVGASLTASDLEAIALSVIPPDRIGEFERCGDLDFAVGLGGVGRFRLNVHRQRGSYGIVVRCVPPGLPTWEQLGLPASIRRLAEHTAGLILIGGPAGSGRSTTAAMLVDQVNSSRAARVVTIENPIEVLHADKRSIISQREVGGDTPSFVEGLQRLLRQDCDVVYVSEVSDASTAAEVFTVAQSGRLVIAVVTATSVESAINRYVDFFPDLEQQVVRRDLASCLRGVSAQKLLERADGVEVWIEGGAVTCASQ